MAITNIPVKFNLYNVYFNDLNKLNPFQFKKVLNALIKYAGDRTLPNNLSLKGMMVFNKIQVVLDAEKMLEEEREQKSFAGSKGAQKRWDKQKNGRNKQNNSRMMAEKSRD